MRYSHFPLYLFICISFTAFFSSCKKQPCLTCPTTSQSTVLLTLDYTECKEVWLKLGFTDANQPRGYKVLRDGNQILSGTLLTTDTLLIDTNVVAGHDYTYVAQRLNGSSALDSSTPLSVRTLDSTSHNFNWRIFTLGDGTGSSTLYDVSIVNDSLAFACGEIYSKSVVYNFAKWNGQDWQLLQIWFYTICGQVDRTAYPASSLIAYSDTNIWIAMSGSQIARWNGKAQTETMCLPISFSISKLLGIDEHSIYAVGNSGNLLHYNGNSWTQIMNGTILDYYDIYGAKNPTTASEEILAIAGNIGIGFDRKIVTINGTTATSISDSPITSSLESVWFIPNRHYYVAGTGIFEKTTLLEGYWKTVSTNIFTTIRGNAINDVFAAGIGGRIEHFNGVTWKNYYDQVGLPNCIYGSISMKGNLVIAVGENSGNACITLGKR